MSTKIEWCDETWNPITGCTHAGSPGCDNCYARRMAQRLAGRFGYPQDDPFKVTFHPDKINEIDKWKSHKRIFVCSMGDLFHDNVDNGWIYEVIAKMIYAKHQQICASRSCSRYRPLSGLYPWSQCWGRLILVIISGQSVKPINQEEILYISNKN